MMTQEELALKAGVGTRTIRDIEAGRVRPQPRTLRLIVEALGLDEADLAALAGRARPQAHGPVTLPSGTAAFTGRAESLAALDAAADDPASPLVVLSGVGGAGKTMLALHWGHRSGDRFPGGRIYVDLRGFGPEGAVVAPAEAVRQLLVSLGVEPARVPADPDARIALYRSLMRGERRLLVLDNARDAAQVRPLLPDSAQAHTLVISRRTLVGLAASHGARVVEIGAFDRAEADALLERQLGAARLAAEPEAAERITTLCAGLPLALAIVGARAATRPGLALREVADELERSRLDTLAVEDDTVDVRAVFSWSYRALDPDAARLFRLLALNPGPDFGPEAAARLHGGPDAERALRTLTEAHLVETHPVADDDRGRHRLHDLIRLYAAELLATEPGRAGALDRLLDWYLQAADACRAALYPAMVGVPVPAPLGERPVLTDEEAAAWLKAEWDNLIAAAEHTAAHGPHQFAWLLADVLRGYVWLHMIGHDGVRLGRAALDAAEADGDPLGLAAAANALGCALMRANRLDEAVVRLRDTAAFARRADWLAGAASAEGNLAVACYYLGRMREGLEHAYAALHAFREIGEPRAEGTNLHWLGLFHSLMGELDTGIDYLEQALKLAAEARRHAVSVALLTHLAEILVFRGRLELADARLREADALMRDSVTIDRTGDRLEVQARLLLAAGRPAEARELAARAVEAQSDAIEHRNKAAATVMLAAARDAAGHHAEAVALYDEVLAMTEHEATVFHRVEAMVERSGAVLRTGDPARAEAAAREALRTARDGDYRFLEGRALNVLAAVGLETGRPEEAAELARQALELHRATGHRSGETESLRILDALGPNALQAAHQSWTVPSARRLNGRYACTYGYFPASSTSSSTPRPGASPGWRNPSVHVKDCRKTSSVFAPCFMYSWMPKL
ncbi:ATP-, maltotriose-and DNA-dependent transcriptional regulator MalT [Glycomyces sambucus]|uniref:ATP-, maltotriose-and DNA-dependent transcriptional regulator MalT n=1 Tax=Glycomyces sambucus TaxID=380244 RepID=A0A1G9FUS7_9ACTN|nr:ATP-, maltotriose-and DNA-dependent transcriptional regulator MalT [Glycomyces sambucus]